MMFDIKNEVIQAFNENRLAIIVSSVILIVSLILGYLLEPNLYSYLNPVVEDLTHKVQSGVIQLTFGDIFFNNLRIIFQMFIYGLVFCISAFILAFNGFFVGYYIATTENQFKTLLYLIPHGIFEFSSCILACAASFVLFNFLYRFLASLLRQKNKSVLDKLSDSFITNSDKLYHAFILFVISVILMMIAGFVEVYLTIPIANLLS